MTSHTVSPPGWYPDGVPGQRRFWDGTRWTDDVRPMRSRFAIALRVVFGTILAALGVAVTVVALLGPQENSEFAGAVLIILLAIGLGLLVSGILLLRVLGPMQMTARARRRMERARLEEQRQEEEQREEEQRREEAAHSSATVVALPVVLQLGINVENDAAEVAQIEAIANPETARALLNLQNLLYTHTITEAEFEAAKRKLFGEL